MGSDSDLCGNSRIAREALRQLDRAACDPDYEPDSLDDLRLAAIVELATRGHCAVDMGLAR